MMGSVSILRAMVANYANGHSWDHLDTKACVKAADRIEHLEAENASLKAEVERLQERWCEICGYAEHHREHTGCLRKQLAASQAREQQLREALEKLSLYIAHNGDDWVRNTARDALGDGPSDTTALEAIVKKAGEVMRGGALTVVANEHGGESYESGVALEQCIEAIRALPAVTPEDLK